MKGERKYGITAAALMEVWLFVVLYSFGKEAKGIVLLLFKKKRTEENSTFPKPLSTYKEV